MPSCLHLIIHGRVQGVFYRDSMCEIAQQHDVRGWVRNRRDGTVEALLQGEPTACEAVLAWARRGPPAARVTEVQVQEANESLRAQVPATFERWPTA